MDEREEDTGSHPDLAELDAFRTGEAADDVKTHVEDCARCRGIVRELSELAPRISDAAAVPAVDVPAGLDARILAAARGRRRRPRYPWWPGLVAAAAALLIAVGVFRGVRERRPALAMDVDGSGQVDIVDAYLLSRRVGSREAGAPAWDLDRDGRVGETDVRLVARRAVALGEEGI